MTKDAPKDTDPSVFIVLSDKGWILERLARDILRVYPNAEAGLTVQGNPDIVYYMTYSSRKQPYPGIEIGYFTHIEEGLPAEAKFFEVATHMDACVTQADLYNNALTERGINNVTTIPCGIDHEEFTPRLQVGIVGRTYHTGRKGEAMMAELMDMEGVDFYFTGDGWPKPPQHIPEGKMGEFYRSLDYVLVPALYEGGPMCVPEALACGTPVIAPEIGWVPDFPHIPYEKGNAAALRAVLEELLDKKKKIAEAAADYTWKRWAEGHAKLFRDTWERLKDTKAAAKSASNDLSRASVIQVLHGGERNSKGGPSVRVPYTAEQLSKLCSHSDVWYGAENKSNVSITHLYNIWQPNTALQTMEDLKSVAGKRVFSPILLDLSLRSFWSETLPKAIKNAGGGATYAANLPMLQAMYERAQARRDTALRGYQPTPGYAAKLKALVEEADHTVFLSAYERSIVESYCGPLENASILRNPVDATFFSPKKSVQSDLEKRLTEEFGIPKGTPFLLGVGRIEVRKNQIQMAALARELDMPLVIAGHIGGQDYADLVTEAGGGKVHLIGRVEPHSDDLLWLYQNCALFLSFSWAEGASLSVLEAAASGAPMLLCDTSSEGEYFGKLAFFAGPLDLKGMVAAAKKAVSSASPEKAIAQHAAVRKKYDWDVHIENLATIYRSLL